MEGQSDYAQECDYINVLNKGEPKSEDIVKPLFLPVEGLYIEIANDEDQIELEDVDDME